MAHTGREGSEALDEYDFVNPKNLAEPIDIVELQLWPPQQGGRRKNIPVWADLRFAEQMVSTPTWRVQVKLAQAELSAQFRGCSVEQGTRLGDVAKKLFETFIEHDKGELNVSQSAEAGAKLGIGIAEGILPSVSMAGKIKSEKLATKAIDRKVEVRNSRISSLPNDRWRIAEINGDVLEGTYLRAPRSDESDIPPLCELNVSNSKFSISLSVKVRPQDLVLDVQPIASKPWWTSASEKPNKEAVAKLLILSAATERFARTGDERVVLAQSTLEGRRRKPSGGPP
ncbi:hypothetical protein DYI24_08695 [Rhodopseudomonas sp. BR0C11]|jgi:hypothetical protein|uniref:hypothetical protein n=1 Tax=Rhodopseudomonas sp. BR0C11 TaxID=2269370 RepID=UPI0013E07E5A|nr:hypothetical protein [Rhodopseudomonas sp. BR0C11]NEV77120.1 hypothetical protein [Rhodopseudomonas sp. BR0C11]